MLTIRVLSSLKTILPEYARFELLWVFTSQVHDNMVIEASKLIKSNLEFLIGIVDLSDH